MDKRNAVLYARYSSDRQNPLSCEDQLREARSYAAAKGWRVLGEYQDAAVSGTRGRSARGGWDELLSFIERGGLRAGGVVLTWDIDRWSRDWADGMIEALRLHKLGVALADTKDGVLDQEGLAGKILLTLKVAGADEFIQKLQRNIKRGLKAKREAGFYTCPPPYGFDLMRVDGGSVLVPNEQEAPLVREIYRMIAEGMTPAAVARELNSRSVPTKRGKAWTPSTVRLIATSPVTLGMVARYDTRAGGRQRTRHQVPKEKIELYEGRHEAIVSRELWHQVQSQLAVIPRGPNSLSPRPLSGLVVCGECGARCHICGGAWPWQGYACRWRRTGTARCTSDRYVEIPRLEGAVRTWVRAVAAEPGVIQQAALLAAQADLEERQRAAQDARPIELEIRELEHKQERLLDSLYAGAAPALVNDRLNQIQTQLEAAQRRLAAVTPTATMVDLRAVEHALTSILGKEDFDLRMVRGFVDAVVLPAAPNQPPVLRAFGVEFELHLDERRRRRGEGKKMHR